MRREAKYILVGTIAAFAVFLLLLNFIEKHSSQKTQVNNNSPAISYNTLIQNDSDLTKGKVLFSKHCKACHQIFATDEMLHITSVEDRVTDRKLLIQFIRDSKTIINSGNNYFKQGFDDYNKIQMPPFPQLSDSDIVNILDYLKVINAYKE